MIPSSIVPVPLRGLREGADPKTLQPGDLLVAKNVRADKTGRLVKRLGTIGIPKLLLDDTVGFVYTPAEGRRLVTRGDDLGFVSNTTKYSFSDAFNAWRKSDPVPNLNVRKKPLLDSTRSVAVVDTVVYLNYLVTLYLVGTTITSASTTGGQLYLRIEDVNTGATMMASRQVANLVASPRLLLRGTSAVVLYITKAGAVQAIDVDMTTFAIAAPVTIATGAQVTTSFSVLEAVMSVANELYIAYELATGTARLNIVRFDSAYTVLAGPIAYGASSSNMLCICLEPSTDDAKLYVAWSEVLSNTAKLQSLDLSTLASLTGPTAVVNVRCNYVFVARIDAANLLFGWCENTTVSANEQLTTLAIDSATHSIFLSTKRKTFGLWAPSKPWAMNGQWYCSAVVYVHDDSGVGTGGPPAPVSTIVVAIDTDVIVDNPPHRHVATLEKETGWFPLNTNSFLGATLPGCYLMKPSIDALGNVLMPTFVRDREPLSEVVLPLGINLHTISLTGDDMFRASKLGASAFCTSGAPFYDDGENTFPAGFIHSPVITRATAAAGGSMVAGIYVYAAVYEWRDRNGVLHRSAPSPLKTVSAVPATGKVDLRIATASICGRQNLRTNIASKMASPVMIRIYRTAGVAGTGPLYSLTLEPLGNVLLNDAEVDFVTFTDTRADSSILGGAPITLLSTQAQLYTLSGELEDTAPPAFITSRVHRGRIAGIASDARTFWLSKDFREDLGIAPGFNEGLTLTFDEDKLALGALDEKWVVLGEDTIDVVHGDGPDDKGQQSTWQIQRVQTDVGCVSPHTVACAAGLLFISRRGIELLDRNLNVTWVGVDVQDTFRANSIVTSAVLVASEQEVRWTCLTNNFASLGYLGVMLVWNYATNVWYTRSYADPAWTVTQERAFADALVINGIYTMMTFEGQVYRETSATALDNASVWVEYDVELADLAFDGPVGWQHIRRIQPLAEVASNCDLRVRFAFNRKATYAQDITFTAEKLATNGGCPTIRIGSQNGANPACKAIRVRVTDATPSSPSLYPVGVGKGVLLSAIGVELVPRPGLPRHGAANSKV